MKSVLRRVPRLCSVLAFASLGSAACQGSDPIEDDGDRNDAAAAVAVRWNLEPSVDADGVPRTSGALAVERPDPSGGPGIEVASIDLGTQVGFCRVVPAERMATLFPDSPSAIECTFADVTDFTRIDRVGDELVVIRSFDNPSGEPENEKPDQTLGRAAAAKGAPITVTHMVFPVWVEHRESGAQTGQFELRLRLTGSAAQEDPIASYDACSDLAPAEWTGDEQVPLFALRCARGGATEDVAVMRNEVKFEQVHDLLQVRIAAGGEVMMVNQMEVPLGARVFLDFVTEPE